MLFKRVTLLATSLVLISGCASIQRGNERYYYKRTIQLIDELPDETKQLCGYKFDREMPTMATADRGRYLVMKNEIRYNASRPNELVHEYFHFFARQDSGVSWACMNETGASFAERIVYLEDKIDRLESERRMLR